MGASVTHEVQLLRGNAHYEDVGIETLASYGLGIVERILVVADYQDVGRIELQGIIVDYKSLRIFQYILCAGLYCRLFGIDIEDLAHGVDNRHALLGKLLAGIHQFKQTYIHDNLLLLIDVLIDLLADAEDFHGLPYRSEFLVLLHARPGLGIVGEFLFEFELFLALALLLAQCFFVEDKTYLFLEIQQPFLSSLNAKLLYEETLHILQLLVLYTAVLLGCEGKQLYQRS